MKAKRVIARRGSRRHLMASVVMAAAILGACGGGEDGGDAGSADAGGGEATGGEVVIDRFTFMPEAAEVAAGTTVTWTNEDSAAHTVEDQGGLFAESESLAEGDEFSFRYDDPGEYPYICGIHTYMTGTVRVT